MYRRIGESRKKKKHILSLLINTFKLIYFSLPFNIFVEVVNKKIVFHRNLN